MRKNHQANKSGARGTGDRNENKPTQATPKTQKAAPAASQQSQEPILGFSEAAQATIPAFAEQYHHMPHHSSHMVSNQNLSTIGLPSPMGLGATAVPITSCLPNQPHPGSFGQMLSSAQNLYRSQNAPSSVGGASSNQLTSKQIDQISKDLEVRALQGDLDGVQDILAARSDMIPKKTLNVSLRAAVKGCTTAMLDYSIQCVEMLIDAGANINSEEANEGKTALMMACEKGYLELVSNLLDHEALIDHKDQRKRTPLMYAIGAVAQNLDVVNELLDRGADVNEPTLTGLTPLLLATRKEHTSIVKLLLGRGAFIAAQFPQDLNSSLHYACVQGNDKLLQILLHHCTKELNDTQLQETLYLPNREGKTALELAKDLVDTEPANKTRQQIYALLGNLYSAKEKEIEDVVQTLLKKEEQQFLQQNNPAPTQNTVTSLAPSQKSQKQRQASIGSKRKKKVSQGGAGTTKTESSAAIAVQDENKEQLSATTITDDEEFKSAESKTPPKEKYGDRVSTYEEQDQQERVRDNNSSEDEDEDSEDNFVTARSSSTFNTQSLTQSNTNNNKQTSANNARPSATTPVNATKSITKKGSKTQQQQTDQQSSKQCSKKQNVSSSNQQKQPNLNNQQRMKAQSPAITNQTQQRRGKNAANTAAVSDKSKNKHLQVQAECSIDAKSSSGQKSNSSQGCGGVGTSSSLGAVQQPIINQQSWPQIFIQQQAKSPSSTSSSSRQQKQNAAVIENIMQQQQQQQQQQHTPRMDNSEHANKQQSPIQQQMHQQQQQQQEMLQNHGDKAGGMLDFMGGQGQPKNNMSMHQQQTNSAQLQQQQQQQQHRMLIKTPQPQIPGFQGGASGGNMAAQQPHILQVPVQLSKTLDSKRAQLDFILEMQDNRNKMLTYQIYAQKERISESEQESQLQKHEHAARINEYYRQATRYYENFRQLETQMDDVSEQNDTSLNQSFQLVEQLRNQIGNDQTSHALLGELESKLHEMSDTNQKFTEEIDFRKEGEKSFVDDQDAIRQANDEQVEQSQIFKQEMNDNQVKGATKQEMAQIQTQFNNLLIDLENVYGEESPIRGIEQSSRYPQQVYNKLHDEVLLFEEGVKSIMNEMDPVKTVIIEKLSSFIKQVIPNGEVEVYGSHATKLCLHWSDIDLVLKPIMRESGSGRGAANTNDQQQMPYMNRRQTEHGMLNTNSAGFTMPTNTRSWLSLLYSELIKSENRGWLQKVEFIENTTVPVIKLAISFHHMSQNSNGQLLLPNGNVPRYPQIVSTPIQVDITLWSESHNGLPCVSLIKSYLNESQLIEPIILVLKQMLKVWDFKESYTGGLSSYALFLMIVSFLQEKRKPALKTEVNLGETLLEFLNHYAQLDFSQFAICCKMPGEVSDKPNLYQNTNTEYSFFLQPRVVIDDPLMVQNNVGKSAFRFQEIKNIFGHAYNTAFTGCFCSCHLKSLLRNTSYEQNQSLQHHSQLATQSNQSQMLRQAPGFLQYQYPPHYNNSSISGVIPQDSAAQSQFDTSDANAQSVSSMAAPYPAAAGASSSITPQLRTQSQPFQVQPKRNESTQSAYRPGNNAGNLWTPPSNNTDTLQFETNCSCDSVLARLIYGYQSYRRTMESLNPNFAGFSVNPTLPMGGPVNVMPNLPFMGGQNM